MGGFSFKMTRLNSHFVLSRSLTPKKQAQRNRNNAQQACYQGQGGSGATVFPSPNGGPISPDSVLNMLHRVLERTGLPKMRFHDLRHSFATLALQNGVDIKTVSGMLGHFSAGFTLDTYAHVTTAAQKEAANTMGNVLAGAAQNG